MSDFNYHDALNGVITDQFHEKLVLGYKESMYTFPVQERSLQHHDDKQHFQCEHGQTFPSEHRRRHDIRLRRLILPALLILLALGGLLAWSCVNWDGWSTGGVDSRIFILFLIWPLITLSLGTVPLRLERIPSEATCIGSDDRALLQSDNG